MQWIDREIEFPDAEKILCYGSGEIFICELNESKWGYHYHSTDLRHNKGKNLTEWTHWMHLPLPPAL